MLGVPLRHGLEDINLAACEALEPQRGRYEACYLLLVALLKFLKCGPQLKVLVSEDKVTLNLGKGFVEGLQPHLVLMFKRLVKLIVEVSDP